MPDRKCGSNSERSAKGTFVHGNPGKPKGARHRTTRAVEALLEGEAEALTRKAIDMALAGDSVALRLCLDRIAPPRKDGPVRFDLPPMESAASASAAMGAVLSNVASGELTPGEGSAIAGLVEGYRKALETTELEARLKALEERQA
jgi:hypothetical protein